jgi:hypothetical protein
VITVTWQEHGKPVHNYTATAVVTGG